MSPKFCPLLFRWRLEKAFYNHDLVCCGCVKEEQCCYCYDIFPGGHCPQWCCLSCRCPPSRDDKTNDTPGSTTLIQTAGNRRKALTLADLDDIKPQYISSVVVNGWRREYKRKYCLVTMSPQGWWNLNSGLKRSSS